MKATLIEAAACPDGNEKRSGTCTCALKLIRSVGRVRTTSRLITCTTSSEIVSVHAACTAETLSCPSAVSNGTSANTTLAVTPPMCVRTVQKNSVARDADSPITQRRYSARSRSSRRWSNPLWSIRLKLARGGRNGGTARGGAEVVLFIHHAAIGSFANAWS